MLAGMTGSAPLELVHEEDAAQQRPIEARVQHRELPLRSPGVQGVGAAGAPHRQQVAHLKDRKHDKLEERCRREGIEQGLYHNACAAAHGVHASDMFWRTAADMRMQWLCHATVHVLKLCPHAVCLAAAHARRQEAKGAGHLW